MIKTKGRIVIVALLIIATIVCAGQTYAPQAYAAEATDDSSLSMPAEGVGPAVAVDNEVLTFRESGNAVSPRWIMWYPTVYNCYNDNYSNRTNDKVYAGGSSAIAHPVNEEKYRLQGVDSTGSEHILQPVAGVDSPSNISAEGPTLVTFYDNDTVPTDVVISDDSIQLKNLAPDLAVANSTTKVGTGIILYRTAKFNDAYFPAWSSKSLADEQEISFPAGRHIQIAVLMETYKLGLFWIPTFYRILAFYSFTTYSM